MKATLVHKTDAMRSPGGGEVQLLETAAALERLGVTTEIRSVGELDDLKACSHETDVYHFFGTVKEFQPAIQRLSEKGMPCLVSTIAWYDLSAYWHESNQFVERLKAVSRFSLRAAMPGLPSWRKSIYRTASLLLPNSEAEAGQLRRYFGISGDKIRVVPNGVDPRFASWSDDTYKKASQNLAGRLEVLDSKFDVSQAVLCVGRFEPRKNQLGLVRALKETGQPHLFVGGPAPEQDLYYRQCRREASEQAAFLGPVDHDDPLLLKLYSECACLVLPSRFETPGLVALEAALTGTPLVLTERGCTREYFGDLVEYVSPDGPSAIRQAIQRAITRGRRPELAKHVLSRFTWDKAAEATLAAYELVVC